MKANVYTMERKIKELTNKKTFWDDVREIVGFYDDTVFIEDWDIKRLQRVADARYEELVQLNACFLRILRKAKVIKMLTREELKAVHNNIITIMENRVMQMTGCNRQTANLVANEILDLDRDADKLLNEKEAE